MWSNNLLDSGKTLATFFTGCHTAGPNRCPLYENTPSLVESRFNNIFNSLKTRPLGAHFFLDGKNESDYDVIDFNRAKRIIFSSLYSPFDMYPKLAKALAALEKGDASLLLTMIPLPHYTCGAEGSDAFDLSALHGIRCSDGAPVEDTLEEFKEYYEHLAKTSDFADM